MQLNAAELSQHVTHNTSHTYPYRYLCWSLFLSYLLFVHFPIISFCLSLILSCKGKDTHQLCRIEKKHPEAAELVHWKQIATAKETALALTSLPSDNKSKALKLALNHLGLWSLLAEKIKAGREKGKGEVSRRKIPNPTSKLKKSEGQHSSAFGVCFD